MGTKLVELVRFPALFLRKVEAGGCFAGGWRGIARDYASNRGGRGKLEIESAEWRI